ncbi:MAG: DeoR/GlpR transcriptional regulator, partial [Oscillospiraceae bacterium]|nr:DeoR/GlpR transcriptional regulator [Oscillospiraceae bacterium]
YSYGYHAEAMLRGISANKIFLSVDAIDPEHGIMNYIMEDINLKTIGMDNAAETFLLCDHSKFETQALFSVGMLDKITRAITGWELPGETREAFVEAGVDLICI